MKIDSMKRNNAFFAENGFSEQDINISPVFMEQLYLYDPNAPKVNVLKQNVIIQSGDVEKVTNMAKNTQKLIDAGVIFLPRLWNIIIQNCLNCA